MSGSISGPHPVLSDPGEPLERRVTTPAGGAVPSAGVPPVPASATAIQPPTTARRLRIAGGEGEGEGSGTERSVMREELRRLRPLAELGRMAATIAHEVRNPLAGISANAEILRESLDDPADRESIDIILGEVQRLGNLVTDLLYYSRERSAELKTMDLSWLARTTAELSQPDAARLQIDLGHEGGGKAQGDADLSRQALLNVVRNALQACRPGGRVRICVGAACIRVQDDGCGVPETVRARIFEPFVTGRTRGLGLGATVAKRCQQRQGGDLVLAETGPKGSTFVLTWTSA